ncbi:MAG: hypothetical protein LZF85_13605 [Nitrosomonas sp.]|uniref:hypothetical protein n=1 Tax=Nitrosomonas sp. TaxID=42353 RepID=UPI0025CC21FA|nr:hypothetical protein [Nitrosomonas sp.]UJP02773.1 MAG: hypothetical protein LZF85_13605 [Nitrosomonas sp.]
MKSSKIAQLEHRQHPTAKSLRNTSMLPEARFVNNRPESIAQRKLANSIRHSPRQLAQSKTADLIKNSSKQLAQRKILEAMQSSAILSAQHQQVQGRVPPTMQLRHAVSHAQPEPHGVIQRARYSIEKRVSLTTAEKKWEEKDGQSAKKRAVGAMLAVLREEYPLPSGYTKTKDNNTDDNFRGKDFLERKAQILDRFVGVDDSAAEVTSTRASIESDKEAGKRRGTSQAANVSRIAPGFKWIGAHLIKREWGGADNMWNVVAWPQEAEDKWADQFEKSVDTDGLYGRDPGTVAIAVTKEDDTIDQGFIDEVEKFSLEIDLNDPVTAEKAKKTGKFKETVAKKRNYLNRAMESIPIHAAGTNKLGTTTLSTGETRYDEAKESAKSEFMDTVTDALADTSELTRHKLDKTPIPTTMEQAENVEGGKRLEERQKDWKDEKQNYRADKYEFTNTLFPEG